MLIYATPEELAAPPWSSTPTNAPALLRSASVLVTQATRGTVYDVDATGMPTAPLVLGAFRDAVCSQAVTWAALGIDPTAVGVETGSAGRVIASKGLGPASISYAGSDAAAARRALVSTSLSAEARGILDAASLLNRTVRVRG
ncbi:hypothetical protein ACFWGN_20875 [Oerskovia sp. NPDC060338]|uniref:hypothetical protein n=1 Tax=Oerskovia sp. NPDC060338 TaxID=3347100 RepID=UPI003663FBC4